MVVVVVPFAHILAGMGTVPADGGTGLPGTAVLGLVPVVPAVPTAVLVPAIPVIPAEPAAAVPVAAVLAVLGPVVSPAVVPVLAVLAVLEPVAPPFAVVLAVPVMAAVFSPAVVSPVVPVIPAFLGRFLLGRMMGLDGRLPHGNVTFHLATLAATGAAAWAAFSWTFRAAFWAASFTDPGWPSGP